MNKTIVGDEARQANLRGARIMFDAVKATYGPISGNVGIDNSYNTPTVTHDGVTVAKSIELSGPERINAELIKKAAVTMDGQLGDGTSTVTLLTCLIEEEAEARISLGENPMQLRRQLDKDVATVLAALPEISTRIEGYENLAEIATISAGDKAIGQLVAQTIEKIGKDSSITVEGGTGLAITADVVEGFTFQRGFVSPYMVTDFARVETVLTNPLIYITDTKLTTTESIKEILATVDKKRDLLILADDIAGEAIELLVTARLKLGLNVVGVKLPSFSEHKQELKKDIEALVGFSSESLGSAARVIIGKDETTIIHGNGDITERLKEVTAKKETAETDFEKEQATKRLADLQGKVAVIKVGGQTEVEIEEKKFRVDDAVAAAKAALEEGIVPGGGTTLRYLAGLLPEDSVLGTALKKPFELLLTNAGIDPAIWKDTLEFGKGVNVFSPDILVDMRTEGIIDPSKTIREAISIAASTAGVALTMTVLIIEEQKNV